ncbi:MULTISPECIES: substrate-binding periplasmic protein [Marinobacter]|uniref:ABC transporter substrate-binding protein n=1 Tax=Marinobacter suaedae TaxID=3057675 RepID=A0ABT8VZH7_9GAMM|nr:MULTISPECIES: ABC transporter substrate-binding protein [unclassified Marinobacter]MBZ2169543.1 ABC transporter substrate-binding protein [Marinobacter sp. F4216]MDO3721375.1 ABC transporter substrate-binding protein [Marinobacter sp. chi1]
MQKIIAFFVAVLGFTSVSVPALATEKLYIYTENFPPYNMSSTGRAFEHTGEGIDGLCTELVKAVLDASELDYVIKLRNWDYGYNRALSKKNHGIYCTTYTENRAPEFQWVGPLTSNLWTVFAPAGSDLEIDSLEDTKDMLYAGYRGDVMTEYLLERGYQVSEMESDDVNPKRLELGQVDLWIADRLAGPYFASQQNVEGLVPVYSFNNTELYLAMNLETPDEVMDKLNEGLETIKRNGLYEALQTKYGL